MCKQFCRACPVRAPKAKQRFCHWLSASHKSPPTGKLPVVLLTASLVERAASPFNPPPKGKVGASLDPFLCHSCTASVFAERFALCGAFAHRWCATGRARQNCWRTNQRQVIAEPLTGGRRVGRALRASRGRPAPPWVATERDPPRLAPPLPAQIPNSQFPIPSNSALRFGVVFGIIRP